MASGKDAAERVLPHALFEPVWSGIGFQPMICGWKPQPLRFTFNAIESGRR